ncbi:MAG: FKBP-type peptidyl-prolyl cis-trans isomerase [Planctomycetota bacterium]
MAFRRPLVLALALATLPLGAGCGEKEEGGGRASVVPGWDLSSLPPAQPVRVIEGDRGLWMLVLEEGTGDPLPPRQPMDLQYTLRFMNGRVVEQNTIPALVRGGDTSGWIAGFLQGQDGIRMMERRRILVPAALGYGANGKAPSIPPNSRLVFDLRPVQLVKEDLVVGTGKEAQPGSRVLVGYEGRLDNGTLFDASSMHPDMKPWFQLKAGTRESPIPGWILGVPGMKVGGKRKLWIPSHLAYGATGAGRLIPPHADLSFTVELLEVE